MTHIRHPFNAVLARQKIVGVRRQCAACPIAEFLRRKGWEEAYVKTNWIGAADGMERIVHARTPPAVAEFVLAFDAGEFPARVA